VFETEESIHRETVTAHIPPTVFGAARGPLRLGALALPSETISGASFLTVVVLFSALSSDETLRYFFRMKVWWWPAAFSAAGLAVSLWILLVGMRRPGPAFPRVWALVMVVSSAVLMLAGLAAGLLPPVPSRGLPAVLPWLADPFPLHALSLSVAAGSVVLLTRLLPVHPLYRSVQAAAPIALALVLVPVWWGASYLIASEIRIETETLKSMAASLDEAADGLSAAAHFDYTAVSEEEDEQRRVEEALAGLGLPSELALPDARRWSAAGVLERSGAMTRGQLESSVRGLIDAIAEAATPDSLPAVRGGRFRLRSDGRYLDSPDPAFERAVGLVVRYQRSAARWLPLLARIQTGPVVEHAIARRRDIEARLAPMRQRGDTAWRAWQTELVDELVVPGRLGDLLKLPFGNRGVRAPSEVRQWANLQWRPARLLRPPDAPCEVIGPRVSRREPIIAPDDRLTPEELEERQMGLASFYVGTRIDASAFLRCFSYHPPFGSGADPDDFVVTELRLSYSVQGRELSAETPCRSLPCGRGAEMPAATMPAVVQLIVDVPPGGGAGYADEVNRLLESTLSNGTVGAREPHPQPDGRSAVSFLLKAQ